MYVLTVEPRPSALNMTLPVSVARAPAADIERWLVCGARSYRSISAARARAQQQTSRMPLLVYIDGTHRQTNNEQDPVPRTVRAVSIVN